MASSDLSATILNNDCLLELSYRNSGQENDQSSRSVVVRCEDGSSYAGDILVGADGGSSPIRENMYREIQKAAASAKAASSSGRPSSEVKEATLHPSDYAHSRIDQQCVTGITEPMASTAFPVLRSKSCELMLVLPKDANCAVSGRRPKEYREPTRRNTLCIFFLVLAHVLMHFVFISRVSLFNKFFVFAD